MALLTTRFQMIEIPVGTVALGVGARLKVPDQPQLRTQTNQIIVLQQLQTWDGVVIPNTPSGATNATVAAYSVSYLVLNVFGIETNLYIPLTAMNITSSTDTAVQRGYSNTPFRFNNITKVDWSKSFIQFGAVVQPNQTFMIGVWYYVVPDDNLVTAPTPYEMPIVS